MRFYIKELFKMNKRTQNIKYAVTEDMLVVGLKNETIGSCENKMKNA